MKTNELIKQRRKELRLTMKDVANFVGVSEATVSRWESGDIANMGRDKIAALANILKLSPSVIAGYGDSSNLKPPSKSEQLLQLINDLSDENKDKAIEYFQFLLSTQK